MKMTSMPPDPGSAGPAGKRLLSRGSVGDGGPVNTSVGCHRRGRMRDELQGDTEAEPLSLGQGAQLLRLAVDRAPEALAELERATTREKRFYALTGAANAALYLGQTEQLASFGPTMQLAAALLNVGETDAVLKYLAQCRAFSEMGPPWLDVWEPKIRHGVIPNFFMHRYR